MHEIYLDQYLLQRIEKQFLHHHVYNYVYISYRNENSEHEKPLKVLKKLELMMNMTNTF